MNMRIAKARGQLARRLNRLLLGPVGGQTSFTRSLDEVAYRQDVNRHVSKRETMFDARVVRYPFPEHYPPQFRRVKAFDERRLFLLHDVIISPYSGQVWTPEGQVLEESVGSLRRIIGWGATVHEPLLPIQRLERSRPIVACPPTGYFHWLLEVMPGLLRALTTYPETDVLLPPTAPRYVKDALYALFGAEMASRVVTATIPVRTPQAVLPAIEPFSGFVRHEEAALLRDAFAPTRSEEVGKRIYVSRGKAPKRRLDNEHELEDALTTKGFEVVHAENLTFSQQVATYQGAETIVAPHGAGLANLVWARPGTRVIEVFPATMFNDCYARLAVTLGQEYAFVTCSPGSQHGVIPVGDVLDLV